MIRMPWTDETAPNLMLEITDACNIACRVCYKKPGDGFKAYEQVERDLDSAMRLRKLHTVTLTGGEPTLHPDLLRIVERIKSEGLHAFLLTNGVLTDREMLMDLKGAGLDSILFHVDCGQKREDLPGDMDFRHVRDRLDQLVQMSFSCGLDVSISFTLYDAAEELDLICRYFLHKPELTFLFLARGIDPDRLYGQSAGTQGHMGGRRFDETVAFFREAFGVEPFSYIPGKNDKPPVWVSFFVPIVYRKDANVLFPIKANWADSLLMRLPRVLTGRYIHKTTHKPMITLIRTLVNGVGTLRLRSLLAFLWQLRFRSARLHQKTIVYDDGPYFEQGELVTCEYCPTAVVRDGEMLSCCEADYGPEEGE